MRLAVGTRLGRYEVLGPLGAGGMGEVYRARDPDLGREVAIKVVSAQLSASDSNLRRFEQEAKAASALDHPGILTVFDVGTHEGSPFLVTELVDGQTLREYLRVGPPPVPTALDLGGQIAKALAAAHDKGIVHRDLKPENLFVRRDGRVKVLDFGLAKLREPAPSGDSSEEETRAQLTAPGTLMGTVGYMAPEQLRGESDARSDVFTLGCVLYELFTGRRAFSGPSAADIIGAVLKDHPPSIGESAPTVPEPARRVVERCLAKAPAERFPSARECATALDEAGRSSEGSRLASDGRWLALTGALAIGLLALGSMLWLRRAAPPVPVRSLAVLPLVDLSAAGGEEYLADGMTEALITRLAQVRALKVISRTSVMRFKKTSKPLPEIARELGVDTVVEGSVQRAGGRVRITAQLIDAKADAHLWAREYERDLTEALTLQAEVARAIAQEIAGQIRPEEARRLAAARPVDPEVFELVLRGRFNWNKRSPEGIAKAEELFREAVRRDPGYAAGHAGLADVALTRFDYGLAGFEESARLARASAQKALELDADLAASHASLAHVHLHDWVWADSEREFRRATELDPSYVVAHHWLALCLTAMGRVDEAVAAMQRARELDPLSIRVNADLGMAFLAARRYEDAVAQEDKTLQLDPKALAPRWIKSMALVQLRRFTESTAEMTALVEADPDDVSWLGTLGHLHAVAGRGGEARRVLARLMEKARSEDATFPIALVHAGLGEKENALEWLEKAVAARSGSIRYLKVEPRLDALRGEARYQRLMEQVGLGP